MQFSNKTVKFDLNCKCISLTSVHMYIPEKKEMVEKYFDNFLNILQQWLSACIDHKLEIL